MKVLKNYFFMVLGVLIISAATGMFFLPNKIVSGGVSGISTVFYHLWEIEPGISYAVINTVLLVIGYKTLGRVFVVRTMVASVLMSVFVQFFSSFPKITDNLILASLFGAVMYGIGTGLALVSGSSTGGTDIFGRLVQNKYQYVSIGKLLLVADGVIILVSFFVFREFELTLYGILSLVIGSFAVDNLIHRLNVCTLVLVVSDKGKEMSKDIMTEVRRGVTLAKVVGAYTQKETTLLICALKEREIPGFQEKVKSIDQNAFMIYTQSTHIVGSGFNVYK